MFDSVFCLVQGDKGLYWYDGSKYYFPDKSWKDAKEGFYYNIKK